MGTKKLETFEDLLAVTDKIIIIVQNPVVNWFGNGWVFAKENISDYFPDFDIYNSDFISTFDEIKNIKTNVFFDLEAAILGAIEQTDDIKQKDIDYLQDDNTVFRAFYNGDYFVAIPVSPKSN